LKLIGLEAARVHARGYAVPAIVSHNIDKRTTSISLSFSDSIDQKMNFSVGPINNMSKRSVSTVALILQVQGEPCGA